MSRSLSVPERLGGFGIAVAVAATFWPLIVGATGFGLPCPLRSLTGIPCPGCGLTTAAVALVHGDVGAALSANPAIFGLAGLAVAVVPLVTLRAVGVLAAPRPWSARGRRRMGWVTGLLAIASWVFQLHRLGVV